ncbi:MAG: energy transducer TonB family protein [bacterium]
MAFKNYERDNSGKVKPLLFIIFSLLFHGLLLLVKIETASGDTDDAVAIKYFDLGDAHSSTSVEKVVPDKLKEELLKGQIVDIAKPEIEKKPLKSKFLAEYDNSVLKETRSDFDSEISIRDKKLRKKIAESSKDKIFDNEDRVLGDVKSVANESREEKKKKGKRAGFEGTEGKYISGEEEEEIGIIDSKDSIDEDGSRVVGGYRIPQKLLPYLNGSDGTLSTPSNDHLTDIDKGDETALNTRKYIYSAYFNKIKREVSKHWQPAHVLIIHDPRSHIYGRKDRYTKLAVKISSNGTLLRASVDISAGVDFLDREAINAFKAATPFPPPPQAILNENNTLDIYFGFMVTME